MNLDSDYEHVVSIEIGTSSSGIVLSDRRSIFSSSPKILTPFFFSNIKGLVSKPSTCVLFDPNGNFHSFGEKAEENFENLMEDQEHEEWSLIRNFKSKLNDSKVLDEDFTLKAENGCEMKARKVVSAIIRHLRNEIINCTPLRHKESCVRWVLLVPSFWKQSAKSFMQECAVEAGIEREKILIALEPEAAALYARSSLSDSGNNTLENAKKYMVCDIGGGSIDITICDVLKDGNIREVFLSSQEFRGTETVHAGFNNILEEILGKEDFKAYKESYYLDLMSAYRNLKIKAKFYKPESEQNVILSPPVSLLSLLKNTEFEGKVRVLGGKLTVKPNVILSFFENALSEICKYIQTTFLHPEGSHVDTVLLIGGFSQIPLFEDRIRKEFPDKTIVIPPDVEFAALRGALLYGFNPKIIRERRASFTVGCTHYYRQSNHQESKTAIIDKVKFQKLIVIGTLIGEDTKHRFSTYESDKDDTIVTFFFYATTDYSVTEVPNENCFFIGSASLHFDVQENIPKSTELSLTFVGTVMKVQISCLQSNATEIVYLNFGYKVNTDEYNHVAAIDFGTTYSGFAYLSKQDYINSKGKLDITTKTWNAGNLQSLKTSTCILFNPDGIFDSFGFEAENKFSELVLDGEQEDWYLFRRFKMKLYAEMKISREFVLTAENGSKMDATKVFSAALKYLKQEALSEMQLRNSEVPENYIQWVITVPAIWTDAAKTFMRQCAVNAGMNVSHVKMALEPEAAALFAQLASPYERQTRRKMFRKGVKYFVCDAGGGTIDTTVHEIIDENNHVRELYKASGGDWGGTAVDQQWIDFLTSLSGKEAMEEFRKNEYYDVLDLYRDFELKKRSLTKTSTEKVTLKLPISLVEAYKKFNKGGSFSEAAMNNKTYANSIQICKDKLRITADIARGFFKESIANTCDHLRKVFQDPNTKSVDIILLVGGFAESPLLQNAIKDTFPSKKVIVPKDAGLAVLNGAVLFGHNPSLIQERIAKYTYGIEIIDYFTIGKHRDDYKFERDGQIWCKNIFNSHVKIGEKIRVGECQSSKEYGKFKDCAEISISVYASTVEEPMYITDEGCSLIGSVDLTYDEYDVPEEGKLRVNLSFGGTEIEVKVKCLETGKTTTAYLDIR